MQVLINGKGIELTEAIKNYTEKKIGALEKFYGKIIRADVTVGMENHHHLKGKIFVCECKLEVPGKNLFASKSEKTLYKAIDKIRDYLEAELMKRKETSEKKDKKDRKLVRASKEYGV
ncbi:MAG: Sigma 54 modulation protein/ribosomal protein S30EA [Candidatus Magasanikbacteria bacterium GW2011_GWA2_37_8]|uniref:Sigma 54 modulation protein/ribosomal protein S30EA n=1 Tax=Candidatus Magasanikbacteria bacterium GW2011_GWA2_37_8 TaxID=1619036 RepID=A0A0G0JRB6_9BACT|nr:MAG: Sigma 54 modulation protein/ribosomal protein S30EA [Candidatus Magasanikbacteria bacterium GW2011_GWA2_37_8]